LARLRNGGREVRNCPGDGKILTGDFVGNGFHNRSATRREDDAAQLAEVLRLVWEWSPHR
jgi:hypothetical protein